MGTDDGRTGLLENNKLHDHSEAVDVNVNSEIDDHIESLWMLVMTRWENTGELHVGQGMLEKMSDTSEGSGSIQQVSEQLKRFDNFMRGQPISIQQVSNPAMLKFISEDTTWVPFEKRFDNLTKYTNGLLPRSRFLECIGMNKDSQDFAEELFDVLSRDSYPKVDSIDKEQMKGFWEQISGQSFDSRLQTFLAMIDRDARDMIRYDDVRRIISLSASANKLSNVMNKAEEYAVFIMEELDPGSLGYILTENLKMLLLQTPQHDVRGESQTLKTIQSGNPIRSLYEDYSVTNDLINPLYGAPTQDYNEYEVVLLLGSGTPIINIVKDILYNIKVKEDEENAIENGSMGKLQKKRSGPTNFKTTKAYLYWVSREQGSFEKFNNIINEAAEIDKYGVIEMHAYCTSVFEEDDVRSAFITILQSLYHARNGIDVVSGTHIKARFAEPDWGYLYKQIALNHTGSRIGVFYCGEEAPAKELKQLAQDFSHNTTTKFDFHNQNS
uniref:Ferric reductase NAD binding domain-containing protein n=2 Tax=Lactuca sativa TaxID=4236 RepID=A0A9R1XSN7_LACSA|nr:hypothetical protein LSAT_V11C100035250 [Lactuca sativa]